MTRPLPTFSRTASLLTKNCPAEGSICVAAGSSAPAPVPNDLDHAGTCLAHLRAAARWPVRTNSADPSALTAASSTNWRLTASKATRPPVARSHSASPEGPAVNRRVPSVVNASHAQRSAGSV